MQLATAFTGIISLAYLKLASGLGSFRAGGLDTPRSAPRRSTRVAADVLIEVQGERFAYAGETITVNLHGALAAIQGVALRLNHAGVSMHEAQRQALGRVYGMVQGQAAALSYIDVYWLLSVIAAAMFLLSFALRKNEVGAHSDVAMH